MDYGRRRRNKGLGSSIALEAVPSGSQTTSRAQVKPWNLLGGLYSLLIMTSLMTVVYMMLEQHCASCKAQCNINKLTKHIEDIAKNLTYMKSGYKNLEERIMQFSEEIPKVEEQVSILESLASSIQGSSSWSSDSKLPSSHENYNLYKVINPRPLKNLSAKVMNKFKRRKDQVNSY